jgi:hypothetical protein
MGQPLYGEQFGICSPAARQQAPDGLVPHLPTGVPHPKESAMYQLSRTVPVNEPKKSFLSRHDVWTGLLMKANNALPYVPEMKQCEVVEKGDGWLVRDIMLKDVPLREKVHSSRNSA